VLNDIRSLLPLSESESDTSFTVFVTQLTRRCSACSPYRPCKGCLAALCTSGSGFRSNLGSRAITRAWRTALYELAHLNRKRRITERATKRVYGIEKMNQTNGPDMQNQLAEFKLGRIVLHLLCCCQDRNFLWHWRGIVRELSQGASRVSPASKCDATERCFDNTGGAR